MVMPRRFQNNIHQQVQQFQQLQQLQQLQQIQHHQQRRQLHQPSPTLYSRSYNKMHGSNEYDEISGAISKSTSIANSKNMHRKRRPRSRSNHRRVRSRDDHDNYNSFNESAENDYNIYDDEEQEVFLTVDSNPSYDYYHQQQQHQQHREAQQHQHLQQNQQNQPQIIQHQYHHQRPQQHMTQQQQQQRIIQQQQQHQQQQQQPLKQQQQSRWRRQQQPHQQQTTRDISDDHNNSNSLEAPLLLQQNSSSSTSFQYSGYDVAHDNVGGNEGPFNGYYNSNEHDNDGVAGHELRIANDDGRILYTESDVENGSFHRHSSFNAQRPPYVEANVENNLNVENGYVSFEAEKPVFLQPSPVRSMQNTKRYNHKLDASDITKNRMTQVTPGGSNRKTKKKLSTPRHHSKKTKAPTMGGRIRGLFRFTSKPSKEDFASVPREINNRNVDSEGVLHFKQTQTQQHSWGKETLRRRRLNTTNNTIILTSASGVQRSTLMSSTSRSPGRVKVASPFVASVSSTQDGTGASSTFLQYNTNIVDDDNHTVDGSNFEDDFKYDEDNTEGSDDEDIDDDNVGLLLDTTKYNSISSASKRRNSIAQASHNSNNTNDSNNSNNSNSSAHSDDLSSNCKQSVSSSQLLRMHIMNENRKQQILSTDCNPITVQSSDIGSHRHPKHYENTVSAGSGAASLSTSSSFISSVSSLGDGNPKKQQFRSVLPLKENSHDTNKVKDRPFPMLLRYSRSRKKRNPNAPDPPGLNNFNKGDNRSNLHPDPIGETCSMVDISENNNNKNITNKFIDRQKNQNHNQQLFSPSGDDSSTNRRWEEIFQGVTPITYSSQTANRNATDITNSAPFVQPLTIRRIDNNDDNDSVDDNKEQQSPSSSYHFPVKLPPDTTRSSAFAPSMMTHKISNRTPGLIKNDNDNHFHHSRRSALSTTSNIKKQQASKDKYAAPEDGPIPSCSSSDSSLFSSLEDDDDMYKEILRSSQEEENSQAISNDVHTEGSNDYQYHADVAIGTKVQKQRHPHRATANVTTTTMSETTTPPGIGSNMTFSKPAHSNQKDIRFAPQTKINQPRQQTQSSKKHSNLPINESYNTIKPKGIEKSLRDQAQLRAKHTSAGLTNNIVTNQQKRSSSMSSRQNNTSTSVDAISHLQDKQNNENTQTHNASLYTRLASVGNTDEFKGTKSEVKVQDKKFLKEALSRSFGRSSLVLLVPEVINYFVNVTAGEWNTSKNTWMYSVTVQQQQQQKLFETQRISNVHNRDDKPQQQPQIVHQRRFSSSRAIANSSSSSSTSLCTVARTRRSLADFLWLERALHIEFHGALLIPPLVVIHNQSMQQQHTPTITTDTTNIQTSNIPSTAPTPSTTITTSPVESDLLKNWLNDVMNGIRGAGEVVLPYSRTNKLKKAKSGKQDSADFEFTFKNDDNDEEKKEDDPAAHVKQPNYDSDVDLTPSSPLDLLQSESLETFFYRRCDSLADLDIQLVLGYGNGLATALSPIQMNATVTAATCSGTAQKAMQACNSSTEKNNRTSGQNNDNKDHLENDEQPSFFPLLAMAVLSSFEACIGPTAATGQHQGPQSSVKKTPTYDQQAASSGIESSSRGPRKSLGILPQTGSLPLDIMACTSRVIDTKAIDRQDSIEDDAPSPTISSLTSIPNSISNTYSSELAIHSEVIEATRDLLLNFRQTVLRVVEKLNSLEEDELKIGVAWKGFAMALSNLFGYEKDVENARLGGIRTSGSGQAESGKILRENMPYRKVSRSAVEDCLRVMARQKMDRSIPALKALKEMLGAYLTDLNTVEPSVDMYTASIQTFLRNSNPGSNSSNKVYNCGNINKTNEVFGTKPKSKGWDDIRVRASAALEGVKHQALKSLIGKHDQKSSSPELVDEFARDEQTRIQEEIFEEQLKYRTVLLANERLLRLSLTTFCRSTPLRVARMAWRYWNAEAIQSSLMNTASSMVLSKIDVVNQSSLTGMLKRHSKDEKEDNTQEMELIKKMITIGHTSKHAAAAIDKSVPKSILTDTDFFTKEREKKVMHDNILAMAKVRLGRWSLDFATNILLSVGIEKPDFRVDETNKDLRLVRKYAIGLRENLNRCREAVLALLEAITGSAPKSDIATSKKSKGISAKRNEFLCDLCNLFSGAFVNDEGVKELVPKRSSASRYVLLQAGIDTSDPCGWNPLSSSNLSKGSSDSQSLGKLASLYMNAKDSHIQWLLTSIAGLIDDYYHRIEVVEGFIYMELVGLHLEKHFSERRATALSSFEKKTDITTAMNVATRKRLPQLLSELQAKMEALGPDVSHTTVREAKEAHLESKSIKAALHTIAIRRLSRARECSTERVVQLMSLWAKEEENVVKEEQRRLNSAISALERSVGKDRYNMASFGIVSSQFSQNNYL